MFQITDILARQIFDSRGNPTVEVDVYTEAGMMGRAAVPSGASTGVHEAVELRDGGKPFGGKGVMKAVRNVEEKIFPEIKGLDVRDQRLIDQIMIGLDGTPNKSNLGANAILGVSLAIARAASEINGQSLYQYLGGPAACILPVPSMNVINGGAHAGNALDIQEHMIMPVGAKSFTEAMQMGAETYQVMKSILKKKYGPDSINVGDEGGFAPPLNDYLEPFEIIMKAAQEAGYADEMAIALDPAASGFYDEKSGRYTISGKSYSSEELSDFWTGLCKTYPMVSIEDGFAEDDWAGFKTFTDRMGGKIQIVGDDLFVTNTKRLREGIENNTCNALLLKVNQIGSLSESMDAANLAFRNGYGVMVSHRSGETEDTFIADLSVALGAGQIKTGAPCRTERLAKYNQLLRIEEELGDAARYAGRNFRKPF
ncbi:MAG: phosphopyruvate hydratase [Thermoplasmata archaeon HGW-Thermoplasmata-1]|nr:MAG: phosphopyruvate hydratase [Thermoplasmata archaeon HGW-Thermoplasmata-1]